MSQTWMEILRIASVPVVLWVLFFIQNKVLGRYEAMTYEYSFFATVIALYCSVFRTNGCSFLFVLLMLFLWTGNILVQRHYLLKMRKIVCANREHCICEEAKENLLTACFTYFSTAIAPSFSTWIEESSLFTKESGIIGMTKGYMKADRFQTKKHRMRNKAEKVLAALTVFSEQEKEIDIVTARSFLLTKTSEKRGLLAFDFFGFVSLAVAIYLMCVTPAATAHDMNYFWLGICIVLSAVVSWIGRCCAFGRRENLFLELCYVITAYGFVFVLMGYCSDIKGLENLTTWQLVFIIAGLLVFDVLMAAVVKVITKKKMLKKKLQYRRALEWVDALPGERGKQLRIVRNHLIDMYDWAYFSLGNEKRIFFAKKQSRNAMDDIVEELRKI